MVIAKNDWTVQEIPVSKEFFRRGRNTFTVQNLEDTDQIFEKWFAISQLRLVW